MGTTKSQVSFKFDGSHNTPCIKGILSNNLKNAKMLIEKVGIDVYRVYVAADNKKEETFKVCLGIQCFCVYDHTRDLN